MQAYRHMAVALLDEAFQLVAHSHRRHRDALGAPGITVVGGEHLGGSQHIVEIVHRFALAHKHDVGQRVVLGQRVYLVEYIGGSKASLEALLARLAEPTVHLASHL